MIGFASYAEKAAGLVEKAEAALARHRADRDAHLATKPDGSDLDALIAWKRLAADFDLRVEAGEEALEFARIAAAQQAEKAAEAEGDRRHAAAKRLVKAGEKLTLEVTSLAEKLADALAALEANRVQIDAANAVRGDRDFIEDGESKLRRGPPREVPARTSVDQIWVDRDGNRVRPEGYGPPPGCELREIETVLSPARSDPGIMPPRLADTIQLVDLQGRRLWPKT